MFHFITLYIHTNLAEQSPCKENDSRSPGQETLFFIELKVLLSFSQEPSTEYYPEPAEFSPSPPYLLSFLQILSVLPSIPKRPKWSHPFWSSQ
jgi:hypothetical protein